MFSTLTVHTDIVRLADRYADARQVTRSTLAREVTGSSTWFERCRDGRVTIRSAIAVVEWLAEHWPEGVAWPEEIPHPSPYRKGGTPSANGTKSAPVNGQAIPGTRSASALIGEISGAKTGDCRQGAARNAAVQAIGSVAPSVALAMRLGSAGQIASPMTLCRALGVRRYVYDDVVRRYRDGVGGGRHPRPGSKCARMLSALVAAGDVRFETRREKSAA